MRPPIASLGAGCSAGQRQLHPLVVLAPLRRPPLRSGAHTRRNLKPNQPPMVAILS